LIKKENKNKYKNELLKLLSKQTLTKEEICKRLNKNISQINKEITILELEGMIKEDIGKGYKIIE